MHIQLTLTISKNKVGDSGCNTGRLDSDVSNDHTSFSTSGSSTWTGSFLVVYYNEFCKGYVFQTPRWSVLYSFSLFITFDHNFAVFFNDDITKSFIFTGIYSLFRSIKKRIFLSTLKLLSL